MAGSSVVGASGTLNNGSCRGAGELGAEPPGGWGRRRTPKQGERGRDGDFLCSQGPERHFWVN